MRAEAHFVKDEAQVWLARWGGYPKRRTKIEKERRNKLTVQGRGTPVSVALWKEQYPCSVQVLDNSATKASNAASGLDEEKEVFK